jgi:hypothetical protein
MSIEGKLPLALASFEPFVVLVVVLVLDAKPLFSRTRTTTRTSEHVETNE